MGPKTRRISGYLADVSDVFQFCCSGAGKGEQGRFFIEIRGRGGGWVVRTGAGRVSAGIWGVTFFVELKSPPR